jgi:hypothetical protein
MEDECGLDTEIFGDDPGEFICSICSNVAYPLVITTCREEHPFCEPCISRWFETKKECPICKQRNVDKKEPGKLLLRVYHSLNVKKCIHHSKGCTFEGSLYDLLEEHLQKYCRFGKKIVTEEQPKREPQSG